MTWFDDRGLSYPGPDLEHLGLLHRPVSEVGARQDTHRVRHWGPRDHQRALNG
ncbi:hypothetical protein AB0L47_35295 [Streptomyces bobili]|uniref:hypothetical protein n=1 Tax=Streptomyces bobili TaxID=67280 RepID=UPI003428795A